MSEIFCTECGNNLDTDDVFCSKCGSKITLKRSNGTTIQSRVVIQEHPLLNVGFFGVYTNGRTYLNILYLILLLPLGIFYFTYAVTCFSTFAGLIPIGIGLVLLFLFLLSLPYLLEIQTWLSSFLTGVKIKPDRIRFNNDGTKKDKVLNSLKNKSIYKSFFYCLIFAMPIGIITFTFAVTFISTSIGLMFSWVNLIVEYAIHGSVFTEAWYSVLPTGFWIFLYVITPFIGFFLLTLSLHLLNRIAIYHSRFIQFIAKN
ncbi:MAG TPA: sensor domain-containing protein [Candidatus Bathyarchaeia archaeon]|nr:sensor domain-containing protein [Candidatus Bathyarchaeia archaeon]